MIDAIVFETGPEAEAEAGVDARAPWLAARTLRALSRHGLDAVVATGAELASRMAEAKRPVWLLRAGAWPFSAPAAVLAHAAGSAVVALGATASSDAWQSVLAATGGDLLRATSWPRVDSAIAFDPRSFADSVAAAGHRPDALDLAARRAPRVVRAPSLDVGFHRALRIVMAVTTLHRGGAERVVLDLVAELRALGHDVTLAVLDRAVRSVFAEPAHTVHLRDHARSRAERLDLLLRLAHDRGADAIHVHLFDGDDMHRLCESDVPVVVTVHNSEPGWPFRLARVREAARPPLLLGCAIDVTRQLAAAGLGARVRTAWNGIVPAATHASALPDRAAARAALGVPGDAPVLVAIANHRPQKRLERLPAILAALGRRTSPSASDAHPVPEAGGPPARDEAESPAPSDGSLAHARLVLVGEPVSSDPTALVIEARVRAAAAQLGVSERVVYAGSQLDMRTVYAAADAVISASAFEGLSLVHLEAVAAGVPLVTTRVSGTAELAAKHARVALVDVDASPEVFAAEIGRALFSSSSRDAPAASTLAADFTGRAMAARHVELYARATPRLAARGGVVLVTNNFSTGGAQSSARRLLVELARSGIATRAVVIEEQRDYPTPGRTALERAGVRVDVAPRAGSVDPLVTARAVAAVVDEARPDAVLFWNAIPEHKVLIADLLVGVDVWDVSPGEMYFASFERYLRRPRVGLPYLSLRDYGRLLRGAIVKYEGERERAVSTLGAQVAVITNGVDVPPAPQRRAGDGRVVGTLARIAPDKKLEQLIDAARLRPFELRIAGAPEAGSEGYATGMLGMPHNFVGAPEAGSEGAGMLGMPHSFVGEREAAEFLREIDVFAMISEPGGCPNAILEAMAAGLPIVATDHGAARELLGDAGVIVPRGDSAALATEIHALLDDAARRARLGDAAHARARERFSVARMAADYTRVCGLRPTSHRR